MRKTYPADAMYCVGSTAIVVVDDQQFRFREDLSKEQGDALCALFYEMASPTVVGVRIGDAIVGVLEDAWA